jgi:hypothetical protein
MLRVTVIEDARAQKAISKSGEFVGGKPYVI